jgi:hypothetical protein
MMDGGFDRHGVPAWIRHLTEAFHKPTHRTMIVSPVRKAGVLSRVGANPSGKSANWCTVTEIPKFPRLARRLNIVDGHGGVAFNLDPADAGARPSGLPRPSAAPA